MAQLGLGRRGEGPEEDPGRGRQDREEVPEGPVTRPRRLRLLTRPEQAGPPWAECRAVPLFAWILGLLVVGDQHQGPHLPTHLGRDSFTASSMKLQERGASSEWCTWPLGEGEARGSVCIGRGRICPDGAL